MTQFGTIELGGTKTLVAAGTSLSDLAEPLRVQTTDPESTIGVVKGGGSLRILSGCNVEQPLTTALTSPGGH
jgi:hypothetical protein